MLMTEHLFAACSTVFRKEKMFEQKIEQEFFIRILLFKTYNSSTLIYVRLDMLHIIAYVCSCMRA